MADPDKPTDDFDWGEGTTEVEDGYVNREQSPPDRNDVTDPTEQLYQRIDDRITQLELRSLPPLGQGPPSRDEMVLRVLDQMDRMVGFRFTRKQVRELKANFRRDLSSPQQPYDNDEQLRGALSRARKERLDW